MVEKVWFPKESTIKLDLASNVTITSAAALDTFFSGGTAIEGTVKDITFTESVGDVEQLNFHGSTSREDGVSFQNAEFEEKPPGLGEVGVTAILSDTGLGFIYDNSVAISSTHTRHTSGGSTRVKKAVLLNLTDGSDEMNIAADNAILTAKDTKSTGSDGHFEVTFTIKALPRDWYGPEDQD